MSSPGKKWQQLGFFFPHSEECVRGKNEREFDQEFLVLREQKESRTFTCTLKPIF